MDKWVEALEKIQGGKDGMKEESGRLIDGINERIGLKRDEISFMKQRLPLEAG